MRTEENLKVYNDAGKFSKGEFARLLIENRVAPNAERVVPYSFDTDIYGAPNFEVSTETETDKREERALISATRLVQSGKTQILWISPPGGNKSYVESRMVVMEGKLKDNGGVRFECVGMCGQFNPGQCLLLAERLKILGGSSLGAITDSEDLRSQPIAFDSEGRGWLSYLKWAIPEMGDVWRSIESGKHEENLKKALEMAEMVRRRFSEDLSKDSTLEERIRLGARMEIEVRRRTGWKLMPGGGHGMSSEMAWSMMRGSMGAFDMIYRMSLGSRETKPIKRCKSCEKWHFGESCPKCEKKH